MAKGLLRRVTALAMGATFFMPGYANARLGGTSIVVTEIQDGSQDESAKRVAQAVREELQKDSSLYVVDPAKVEKILTYYQRQPSLGPIDLSEAQQLVERAKEHYFNFAYSEAEAELKRAIELFEQNPDSIFDSGTALRDAYLTLGLVQFSTKRPEAARNVFQQVLELDPAYRFDPQFFTPLQVKLFEEAKEALARSGEASMEVQSDPKVAEVFINGIYKGVTPLTVTRIPPGEYRLLIKTHNYTEVKKQVSLVPGQKLVWKEKLWWKLGKQEANPQALEEARVQIQEGVRVADLLKVDKVVLVDVDEGAGVSQMVLRMIDRHYRAGHNPIVATYGAAGMTLEGQVASVTKEVRKQTGINLVKNPQKYVDPDGVGDPVLLAGRKKWLKSSPILLGALGLLVVGGTAGGIAATSGGSSAPGTGALTVQFK